MRTTITRRDVLKASALCAMSGALPQWTWSNTMTKDFFVYVGTYTGSGSQGIYVFRFDANTGQITPAADPAKTDSPSFLTFDPKHRFLYAANETSTWKGKPGGSISAFSINPETGALTLLNQQSSHGAAPCYVSVDPTGKWAMAANYTGGNVALFPIQDDGKLAEASDVIQHKGSSVNPQRQKEPHAHCILPDAAGRYVFSADLGIDKVMIYRLDPEAGKLVAHDPAFAQAKPGAGPRHFTFHPNGRLAFLIQEINSTITSFQYDADKGALTEVETVSSLPADFKGSNSCADIHVSPSGQFVYGSNRGHNSIVAFGIDEPTGKMTYVGHQSTLGKTPRNFAIDPTGHYLLAANQDSDSVVVFSLDSETGKLSETEVTTKVSKPVCVKFMPINVSSVRSPM